MIVAEIRTGKGGFSGCSGGPSISAGDPSSFSSNGPEVSMSPTRTNGDVFVSEIAVESNFVETRFIRDLPNASLFEFGHETRFVGGRITDEEVRVLLFVRELLSELSGELGIAFALTAGREGGGESTSGLNGGEARQSDTSDSGSGGGRHASCRSEERPGETAGDHGCDVMMGDGGMRTKVSLMRMRIGGARSQNAL